MTKSKGINKLINLIDKFGIYLLGLVVTVLNYSLAFDNVVWGDEAYSQMAIINTDLHGVYERVYYWDSHPPLYYYYLKFIADIFGYHTPVYHIASLVPFTIGIILACTLVKKYMGFMSAAFYIVISGLSESCVEYNLEIRMYSLVFMFTLLCAYCAYRILADDKKIHLWILMTLFGVLAAYTHYFGVAICGIIIFFTGLFVLVGAKGARKGALLKWIVTTLVYIVLYIPWLYVLYFQTQAELGSAWMTDPDPLWLVNRFIYGGARISLVFMIFVTTMSVICVIKETGLITLKKGSTKISVEIALNKPSVKGLSSELKAILLFWVCIAGLLLFAYGVSLYHPILAYRYAYVLIPLTLMILMLNINRLIVYTYDFSSELNVAFKNFESVITTVIICGLFAFMLISGLLDFKYYRSLTRTQDVETRKVLDIVGTPNENAVLVSNGVKHLSWSVLQYYYPNFVTTWNPDEVAEKTGVYSDEFWCFNGLEYENKYIRKMKKEGYNIDEYPDMWMGKYNINLYHFYK